MHRPYRLKHVLAAVWPVAAAPTPAPNGEQDINFERIEAQRFMSLCILPMQMSSTSSAQV